MASDAGAPEGAARRLLRRAIDVRPEEVAALGWSWLYVFSILSAYYVLRPIRDEAGVQGGVDNLAWLFTATLLAMLAVNPAFAALVRRLPRVRFITIAYRFFMLNLVAFIALFGLAPPEWNTWIGRVFFVWTSVFNLFVVSVFWAFIVDVFDREQGKRLFGFLAAGATLGAILGSSITSGLVAWTGTTPLLLASILLLELSVLAVRRLSVIAEGFRRTPGEAARDEAPIGGGIWAGLTHTFRSPYLLGLAGFILLYSVTSTFLYFEQASIVASAFASRAARTAYFANVDLLVNTLTLLIQLFLTSRLLGALGVGATLAALPLFSMFGFGALALWPGLAVLVAAQVARRVSNFALARPSREVLFTVLPREDKYKAKSFIDTVVYRAGDQIGSWSYAGLAALGLGLGGVAVVGVPLSLAWLLLALWLGRRQEERAASAPLVPARSAAE
ncbi:MFS transporter [Roseomonas sp. OT10]|uniref:NTP/NDP exchange transporter n=1 Tax=Roseomonas cutis TaxID=2897332 RepID=UPI001E3D6CA1|nr:MFS transporter [Roseomonas sp. OT10]UFN50318.1 MFS transporter [Roseomonas sp. OT10]